MRKLCNIHQGRKVASARTGKSARSHRFASHQIGRQIFQFVLQVFTESRETTEICGNLWSNLAHFAHRTTSSTSMLSPHMLFRAAHNSVSTTSPQLLHRTHALHSRFHQLYRRSVKGLPHRSPPDTDHHTCSPIPGTARPKRSMLRLAPQTCSFERSLQHHRSLESLLVEDLEQAQSEYLRGEQTKRGHAA